MEDFAILKKIPEIHSFGFVIFDPIWAEREHASSNNELIFVIEGRVDLHMGKNVYSASKGDLLLIPSNTKHRDEFDLDSTFKTFMLQFRWAGKDDFFARFRNDLWRGLSEGDRMELTRMINSIQNELIEEDAEINRMIANSTLHASLLFLYKRMSLKEVARDEPDQRRQRRLELIKKTRLYVERNYNQMITLESIACDLGVSPHHLSHVFSQETNFSLFSYITSVRMENAKKLLMKGTMFVSEVAEAVGYNSESYFTKVFKKYFHHTPSHFQGGALNQEKHV